MATEDYSRPARGLTENGFSQAPVAPARRRLPPLRKMLMVGGVAAVVLGLGFGLAARPQLVSTKPAAPMVPVSQTPSDPQLAIVVSRTAPPVAPKAAGGRLEVLPAYLAEAAPRAPATDDSFRSAAADTINDLIAETRADQAANDQPIDCARPADSQEVRICRDIGFEAGDGYRHDEPPRFPD